MQIPLSGSQPTNCLPHEVQDITGQFQQAVHTVTLPDGTTRVVVHINSQGVTGVGETTGASYPGGFHDQLVTVIDANGQIVSQHGTGGVHINGQGQIQNERGHTQFRYTLNPDGTYTVSGSLTIGCGNDQQPFPLSPVPSDPYGGE
jgi:hypothetical protein